MTRLPRPAPEQDGDQENRWVSHRVAAFAIRTAVRLVPVGVAVGVAVFALHLLPRSFTHRLWPGQVVLVALAVAASLAAERLARRALPLAVLLQLTLLFPDRAPSRLKVARNGGKLDPRAAPGDPNATAERVLGLLADLTAHDRRTRGHCERVRVYADLLASELGLPRPDQDRLRWAALLHDIGKLEVAPEILNKPGKPSDREWLILRSHPEQGATLTAPLLDWLGEWGTAIEQHHERYDGAGYPRGLAGETISRAGRLLAIVDAYEVMTAARAYKRAMNARAARSELARCAGTHFDPLLVRAFLEISLPRLLWTTGPLALAGQLPVLRAVGQLSAGAPATGGTLAAASAGSLLAASLAVSAAAPAAPAGPAPGRPATRPLAAAPLGGPAATAGPRLVRAAGTGPGSAAEYLADGSAVTAPVAGSVAGSATGSAAGSVTAPGTAPVGPVSAGPGPAGPPPATGPVPGPLDTTAPVVTMTAGPASPTSSATAHFAWTADDPAATFRCATDGGAPVACASGSYDATVSGDGTHTFVVLATDAAGKESATSTTWTLDTTPPVITLGPGAPTASSVQIIGAPTITWSVDDPTATVTCSYDGGAAFLCPGTSYTPPGGILSTHTFVITATDALGNSSSQTASWTEIL